LDQANGGETFSPTQFALPGVLLEFFFCSGVPSLKVEDVKIKGSAAFAIWPADPDARIIPPARNKLPRLIFISMTFPPSGLLRC